MIRLHELKLYKSLSYKPFSVPTFTFYLAFFSSGVFLIPEVVLALLIRSKCFAQWGGVGGFEVRTWKSATLLSLRSLPVNFPGKETKQMTALDLTSRVFYHFKKVCGLRKTACLD